MTRRQAVKRFFEPVIENPRMWLKASWQYFLLSVGPIITIIFLKHITATIDQGNKEAFFYGVLSFALIMLLYYVCRSVFRNWGWVPLYAIGEKYIYKKYIPWFVSLDNTVVEKIGTGRMISIVQQGFRTWIDILSLLFQKGMDLVLCVGLVVYVLYTTASYLILLFIPIFIIVQYVVYRLNIVILQNKRLSNPINNEYTRSLIRIIMSKFEIMQQNRVDREMKKLDKNRQALYDNTKKRSLYIEGNYLLPNALVIGLYIVLFLVVGYGIFDGSYSFADLVLFTSTLALLDRTLDTSSSTIKDFFQDYSKVEQLRETFDTIPKNNYTKGLPFTYSNGDIVLSNVSFAYDDSPVLSKLSLIIKGGSKTAFVGESGGGKSTLLKLLAGYIGASSGKIIIDGQKLSDIKLIDYYRHIGYLTQDPSVFDGTVYENLCYALDKKPDNKTIQNVLKLAKCEFVLTFKKGLQTQIGERGVLLSGGQKQRLAIAKIMLKNPSIILLDEPTSALDSFNEEQISIALHNLFQGKTVIVIAHRLQTVKQADRILFFENGKIIEDGTHQQLVKKNGKYKRMLDLQSGF